jgi:hypothetical protein
MNIFFSTAVFNLLTGAAIDHEESPRTMLGVDDSMLTAGIVGLLTTTW